MTPLVLVLDTNVFMSAIFFAGTPYTILEAWKNGDVRLVVSQEILDEYNEVAHRLQKDFPAIDISSWLSFVKANAGMVEAVPLPVPVCSDPDDDMFLACAKAAHGAVICSGDKALLATSGYCDIEVLKPREVIQRINRRE